jgi:protein-disulfide isomerase
MEENTQENMAENTTPINNGNGSGSNQSQIAGAIIVAGLIIAGAIMLKGTSAPTSAGAGTENTKPTSLLARPISEDDHIVGNKNAKIIILEYSDLECPFCKNFHATMKQVLSSNSDVAWVYRHYPIPSLHPDATKKAEATECAWEQGGNDIFWAYADKLFEVKYPLTELATVAKDLGLNVDTFNTCLSSGKYTAKVQADIADGSKMDVNGTPSSFIIKGGKVIPFISKKGETTTGIPGAQPYDIIMENITRILK